MNEYPYSGQQFTGPSWLSAQCVHTADAVETCTHLSAHVPLREGHHIIPIVAHSD